MSRKVWTLGKVLISAGLIVYLLWYQADLQQIWKVLSSASWLHLLLAAMLIALGTFIRAGRWKILLDTLEIHVPLRYLALLYFQGAFFSMFLPTGMGGDAVKMAKLAQRTGQVPESIGTTLVERATGLWVLFLLALAALPFSSQFLPSEWITPIASITIAGVIGGWLLMATPLLPYLGSRVQLPGQTSLLRFYRSVSQLGYRALLGACLISLIFDLLLISFNILIANSIGLHLHPGIFFIFTPIISFSLALPISVGGLGVREQTYALLFSRLGISVEAAIAMSLINYILTYWFVGLLGGISYLVENLRTASLSNPTT